jgi:hypothetical protein
MPAKTFHEFNEDLRKQEKSQDITDYDFWKGAKANITYEEALKVIAQEIIRRAKELLGEDYPLNQEINEHRTALTLAHNSIPLHLAVGNTLGWDPQPGQVEDFNECNKKQQEHFKNRRKK